MELADVKQVAKEKLKGYCRVCPTCDGRACVGEVPGLGGTGTGASFHANMEALKKWRLNLRTIHDVRQPSTSVELWGMTLSMPILAAPMTGCVYNMGNAVTEEDFSRDLVHGCRQANTVGMTGDGAEPAMYESGLKAVVAAHGMAIPVIKPRAQDEVLRRIRQAEAAGARAVGMDVDGAGLITMALKGQPVGPKSPAELRQLISATKLPFIIKGVMTPDEAVMAAEVGAAGIVVSNHGGRILDHTPGAAEVLPAIASRVKGRIKILADGGVRSGADVLKLVALGADAVLVGRPLIVGVAGDGQDGVALVLKKMCSELLQAMLLTGVADIKHVDDRILYQTP